MVEQIRAKFTQNKFICKGMNLAATQAAKKVSFMTFLIYFDTLLQKIRLEQVLRKMLVQTSSELNDKYFPTPMLIARIATFLNSIRTESE